MFKGNKWSRSILAGTMSLAVMMGTGLSASADNFLGRSITEAVNKISVAEAEKLKDNPLVVSGATLGLPTIVEKEMTLSAAESKALSSVDISLHCGTVKIISGSGKEAKILLKSYVKHDKEPLSYTVSNGSLKIKDNRKIKQLSMKTGGSGIICAPLIRPLELDSKKQVEEYTAYLKENIISLEITLPAQTYKTVKLGEEESQNKIHTNNWENQLVEGAAAYTLENASVTRLSGGVVSGEITAKNCQFGSVNLGAVNGTVNVYGGKAENLEMACVNGEVQVENCSITKGSLNTVNGEASIKNSPVSQSCSVSAVNGEVMGTFAEFPEKFSFNAVNGEIQLALPENSGFYISGTLRADIDSDFALTKKNGTWSYGDGSRKLKISAVNGDIEITRSK